MDPTSKQIANLPLYSIPTSVITSVTGLDFNNLLTCLSQLFFHPQFIFDITARVKFLKCNIYLFFSPSVSNLQGLSEQSKLLYLENTFCLPLLTSFPMSSPTLNFMIQTHRTAFSFFNLLCCPICQVMLPSNLVLPTRRSPDNSNSSFWPQITCHILQEAFPNLPAPVSRSGVPSTFCHRPALSLSFKWSLKLSESNTR